MKTNPQILSNDQRIGLYRSMLRMRSFEDTASALYKTGEIPGFVHCYQGEEAVAAGVSFYLRREDIITSTHRGHGHVIAKGIDCGEMMAELYGKVGGCSGGRGGSMHSYNMDVGLLGTNGMVGGGIGLAVGAAYALKYNKTDNIAVTYFGDGASNMGILYESMNLASKWKLPVLFVCENNLYATATPLDTVAANAEIATRAAAFCMPGIAVDGNDVEAVWRVTGEAVERARSGEGPTLIEAKTYRTHGHHEGDQVFGTYRTRDEWDEWVARDPIVNYRKVLSDAGVSEEVFKEVEAEIKAEMDKAVAYARESVMPDPASVLNHVFWEVAHV